MDVKPARCQKVEDHATVFAGMPKNASAIARVHESARAIAGHGETLNPLAVKLQPVDDLVDHLALGAHGKADQIEFGADHGLHHFAVGRIVGRPEHVLGIDGRLDVARQRPLRLKRNFIVAATAVRPLSLWAETSEARS